MTMSSRQSLIDALMSSHDQMSDHLMTVLLTLEILGSARYMTEEDFEGIKAQIILSVEELKLSRDLTQELDKLLNHENRKPANGPLMLELGDIGAA